MLPLVAALLKIGLPLLGNAVMAKGQEVIEEKLGVKLPDVSAILGDPATQLELKKLEVAHEEFLINAAVENRKLDTEDFKLETQDKAAARIREVEIAKTDETPWWMPSFQSLLSLIVIIGGGWMLVMADDTDIRLVAASSITLVLGYYYGTTKKSGEKDSTIQTLAERK